FYLACVAVAIVFAATLLVGRSPLLFLQWFGARCDLHSFPTRRSSDLRRRSRSTSRSLFRGTRFSRPERWAIRLTTAWKTASPERDRKSTRLNSSHDQISYADLCLKKKKYRVAITNSRR